MSGLGSAQKRVLYALACLASLPSPTMAACCSGITDLPHYLRRAGSTGTCERSDVRGRALSQSPLLLCPASLCAAMSRYLVVMLTVTVMRYVDGMTSASTHKHYLYASVRNARGRIVRLLYGCAVHGCSGYVGRLDKRSRAN